MSEYIAGGLMILLLVATALLGLEAYDIYHAAHMVEAALLDGQIKLAADGGVSPAVARLVRERIAAEGGDLQRLRVTGSAPRTPYGEPVTLRVEYKHPFALPLLGSTSWQAGGYRVERRATIMSGFQP